MTILDRELRIGHIVTYCGPETDWEPRVAIQEGERLVSQEASTFKARIFRDIREAVYWARDNGFDYVTMTDMYWAGGL